MVSSVPLTPPHADVAALADRAFRAGVRMPILLRRAGVPASTWMRWLRGQSHTSATMDKLWFALTDIIMEDEHAKEKSNAATDRP